jgi:hypothetical protein
VFRLVLDAESVPARNVKNLLTPLPFKGMVKPKERLWISGRIFKKNATPLTP